MKRIRPGEFTLTLVQTIQSALENSALLPIATTECVISDGGVDFLVRAVDSLARKAEDKARRCAAEPKPANPFLPPEPDLTVGSLGEHHIAVLNKFNVLERHLLLVTRDFVHQETLLDTNDFAALALALRELDALGFYNGGEIAGASQPHKHLQIVPLPLSPATGSGTLPMDALIQVGQIEQDHCTTLPFAHALRALTQDALNDPARLYEHYRALCRQLGIMAHDDAPKAPQRVPYNLLLTRRWIMLVPRSREHVEGISINGLGFAGSLFVKRETDLERVRALSPMAILRAVASSYGHRTENP